LSSFTVRRARANDLQQLWAIEEGSFNHPYSRAVIERLMNDYPEHFLVAEQEGKIVGYCVASAFGDNAHLISIAVMSGHRRIGMGTALLQGVIDGLIERGVQILRLEVKPQNNEAISLYLKFGFERVAVVPRYYQDGSAALKMQLRLGDKSKSAGWAVS